MTAACPAFDAGSDKLCQRYWHVTLRKRCDTAVTAACPAFDAGSDKLCQRYWHVTLKKKFNTTVTAGPSSL